MVRPADQLLDKLQRDLTALSTQMFLTPRKFQALLGLLNFLAPLVDLGRLHMRPLQFWLTSHWDHSLPTIDRPFQVNVELQDALEVWTETAWLFPRSTIADPVPRLLSVHGQFAGRMRGESQWERCLV